MAQDSSGWNGIPRAGITIGGDGRIKGADFVVQDGVPRLENEKIVFKPTEGNYVTDVGWLDKQALLIAGNLNGQHEYGMDQYAFDLQTGRLVNLQNPRWSLGRGCLYLP